MDEIELHTATIYTKDDCHLCEEAKSKLKKLQGEFRLTIEEVDIATDPALYGQYKDVIPVVVVDGRTALVSKISEFQLRQAIAGQRPAYTPTRRPAAPKTPVTGRTRDLVIAVDKAIFYLAKHWLLALNTIIGTYAALPLLAPLLMSIGYVKIANLIYFAYGFVCHQMPSRSFFLLGQQMAYCQRNFAIYSSIFLGGLLFALVRKRLRPLPLPVYLLLITPMAIDGLTQLVGLRLSNWWLRVATGSLFGLASVWLAYPQLEIGMREIRETVNSKLHLE